MNEYILGIESSCDDTSAGITRGRKILANVTANQDIHRDYGGVVPEFASRAHQKNIVPVVDAALKRANIPPKALSAIAYTAGPGSLGSLLVGSSFAKSMALALDIPLITVNHMQAHIMAHFIDKPGQAVPDFPFLCLTVSGGHTQIVKVHGYFEYELLGQTIDDAAGEAFDKAAKIMGLPYPGGPLIDRYAQQGNPLRFSFAKPVVEDYNFSFSGLKTRILYYLQKEVKKDADFIAKNLPDLCASIQHTIIEILITKLAEVARDHQISQVALAAGVSANSSLRNKMGEMAMQKGWQTFIPDFEYCTDNGAMIAISGYYKYQKSLFSGMDATATARKKLDGV
ncbi:MAG: tRNA (adenosine(37)-N6)-threonylcarbamoyltransferase complex transferase subunit TsaD [Owenweeksia sp.]|nr:tRNA (adenosine(37)-N6)-threonylcarbamoyltransferase complex transferase subunit TsaD [Owenweeksia sp.]